MPILLVLAAMAFGQHTAGPSFEVVSVKPEGDIHQLPPDAEGRRFFNTKPFRFTPTSVTGIRTLSELVEEAYSVEDWEVVGPPWIAISTYAINAKMAIPATRSEARLMLQTMLAERFGLSVHHESRIVPVVNLTGIQGIYHVEFAWNRDPGSAGRYDPGFWEAIERETGLKAEKRKLPRDVIVIDPAERLPTEN